MELSPNISSHREEKPQIEKFLQVIEDPSFLEEAATAFFGIYKRMKDGDYEFTTSPLSDEEYKDFKIFFLHVAKRIISANSRKYNGVIEYGRDKNIDIKNLDNLEDKNVFLNLLFHDISHCVGQIAKNGAMTNITAIQPFFRYEVGKDYNVKEILEDELRGFMFASSYYPSPTGVRSKLNLESSPTQEEFIKNYLSYTMRIALKDNNSIIDNTFEFPSSENYKKQLEAIKEAKSIADEIVKNPPEDVIKALDYIWKNRDNPRVLADLFFKEVGPYIDELKKRKVYQYIDTNKD